MYNTGTEIQDRKIQTTNKIQKTDIQRYRFAVNSHIANSLQYTQRHRVESQNTDLQVYSKVYITSLQLELHS